MVLAVCVVEQIDEKKRDALSIDKATVDEWVWEIIYWHCMVV